jgi:PPP family 3-phenylpropionic acid transporter
MLALLGSACFALLRGIQSLFWTISIFILLDGLIGSGAGSLSHVQAITAANGEKSGFGSVRLWGSLGWAAVTPVAGLLIERLGLYVPFAGYAAMLVAAVFVLFFVRGSAKPKVIAQSVPGVPVRQMISTLARNRTMIGMALAFTVVWIATMGRSTFETLYMTRLGASTGIIGIASTVSALFEVPTMLRADRLVRRHGSSRILRISMLAQAISFLPVVLFPSIASFFILRIMASIAMSLNVTAYYSYLVESAPVGQGGTVISLFDVTLRNGISLLAAPLAGYLFDLLGAYWLYPIGLGGCLLAWLILEMLARPLPSSTV